MHLLARVEILRRLDDRGLLVLHVWHELVDEIRMRREIRIEDDDELAIRAPEAIFEIAGLLHLAFVLARKIYEAVFLRGVFILGTAFVVEDIDFLILVGDVAHCCPGIPEHVHALAADGQEDIDSGLLRDILPICLDVAEMLLEVELPIPEIDDVAVQVVDREEDDDGEDEPRIEGPRLDKEPVAIDDRQPADDAEHIDSANKPCRCRIDIEVFIDVFWPHASRETRILAVYYSV